MEYFLQLSSKLVAQFLPLFKRTIFAVFYLSVLFRRNFRREVFNENSCVVTCFKFDSFKFRVQFLFVLCNRWQELMIILLLELNTMIRTIITIFSLFISQFFTWSVLEYFPKLYIYKIKKMCIVKAMAALIFLITVK